LTAAMEAGISEHVWNLRERLGQLNITKDFLE